MAYILVFVYGEDEEGQRVMLDAMQAGGGDDQADSKMYREADYCWRSRKETWPDAQRQMIFVPTDPYAPRRVMRDETGKL